MDRRIEPRGEGGAGWTSHPATERAFRDERRRKAVDRRVAWAVGLGYVVLCPFTSLGLISELHRPWGLLFGIVAMVSLGVFQARRSAAAQRRARSRQTALRESHGALGDRVVELTVFQGATPTGTDRGAAWFEDDRFYFAGDRTSFSLSSDGVAEVRPAEWRISGVRSALTIRLKGRTAAGSVAVGLDLLDLEETDGTVRVTTELDRLEGLRAECANWAARSASSYTGLPPLGFGPGAPTVLRLFFDALAITGLWLALAAVGIVFSVLWGWYIGVPIFAWFLTLLWLCSDVWTFRARWRSLRDRIRLEVSQ